VDARRSPKKRAPVQKAVTMLEESAAVQALLDLALQEDIGNGDVTTQACVSIDTRAQARLVAKQSPVLVLAGLKVFAEVFRRVDDTVWVEMKVKDGELVRPGTTVAEVNGPAHSILTAERTALNFVMRLSGVATQAFSMKAALKEFPHVKLMDTRKTTPGMRLLEKAAVASGGGTNHRMGLFDGVLIKDNHVAACGGIKPAIERARARAHHLLRIECEVTSVAGAQEAIDAGADAILLDNMDLESTRDAVKVIRAAGRPIFIEASGNMTFKRLPEVAGCGVDGISMGALTHSAASVDFSLEFGPANASETPHGG
jgi:nicotinate-nucleotide pyrophosphorylase (carboxylating)